MPVSHLGLTVSHIPSATSFYLSALQPLGYRYIGHQENSIGLGIDSADFFITQSPIGTRPSPNHIAFLADSRLIVRECYAAALNSGAHPNGAPNYRNDDCSCFNAAVEDPDGNTVEFIFRQPHGEGECCGSVAPSAGQRVLTWQQDVASSAGQEDAQSVAQSMVSRGTLASKASRAKSRMQTALDLASTTSKSTRSEAPSQSTVNASNAPSKIDFPSKTLIGTALGAAAGAAIMFAMSKAESDNAKEEADHLAYMSRSRLRQSVDGRKPPPPRAETLPPSIPPAYSQAPKAVPSAHSQRPKTETRKFHRNFSTTESQYSRRPPAQPTNAMRMIEATGYNKDDDSVQEVLNRYNKFPTHPTRSRTYDEIEYAPAPNADRGAPSGYSMKRATTLLDETEETPKQYLLEAPPPKSSTSRHTGQNDTVPRSSTSHISRHRRSSADDDKLKRHDSGVSMHSSRSRRDRESDAGRRSSASKASKASTMKPPRRSSRDDAYEIVTAQVPKAESKAPSSCYYPAAISLPPSQVSTKVTAVPRSYAGSQATASFVSAKEAPLEKTNTRESWEDFVPGDESDGLGDIKTVVPDDSISCVDLSKPRRSSRDHDKRHSSRHSSYSKHSSRRSETSDRTVRPAKRERDGKSGKKSILGFA